MKKGQKLIAWMLTICILAGIAPMYSLMADTTHKTETQGSYTNNFNVSALADIKDDFTFWYDSSDSTEASMSDITNLSNVTRYVTISSNRLQRAYTSRNEPLPSGQVHRPYWGMVYSTYDNQQFKSYTLTVDLVPKTNQSYHAITLGSLGGSFKSNGGYTFGMQYSNRGVDAFIGTATEVATYFNGAEITDSPNGHTASVAKASDGVYSIRLEVKNGLADVYVNDTLIFNDRNVGKKEGFISLCNGAGNGSYYDNLSITGIYVEESNRAESEGKYTNNFGDTDVKGVSRDFSFYYDTAEKSTNYLVKLSGDEAKSYITLENNALERLFNTDADLTAVKNGNRPYWCMLYSTYKNQVFEDFKLSVDAKLLSDGNTYHAITVGQSGKGFMENGGYTLGFQTVGDKLAVFLGSAADVKKYFNGEYISDCDNKKTIDRAADDKYSISMSVENGKAIVAINGTVLYTNVEVGSLYGNLSFCNGIAAGSYFDNLHVEAIGEVGQIRVENKGGYRNNFNETTLTALKNDFNFYHDGKDSANNTLKLLESDADIAKFFTADNGRLERIFNADAEKNAGQDGNRPYWCMTYATYKNQRFTDFELTTTAHLSGNGTSFHGITMGTMGGGFKSNGGYTLGFQYRSEGLVVYIGSAADVKTNFDDHWIHDCASKVTIPRAEDNIYNVGLTVKDSIATVYINGEAVISDYNVGDIEGYLSFCNGIVTGSYFDDIVINGSVKQTEFISDDGSEYLNTFLSLDPSTLDRFTAYYSDDLSKTNGVAAEEVFSNHWNLSGGGVTRKDQAGENFDEAHYFAMLTYTHEKFSSFRFECDFVFGNAPGRMMIGIGQETLGRYATADGGGLAIVFDSSGNGTLKGKINGKSYGASTSGMLRGGQENHIIITYYAGALSVNLNGNDAMYVEVEGLDGYISLMSTKVPNAKFDNFYVLNYDKITVDPDLQQKVTGIEKVDDIEWNRTEDNSNVMGLPEKLKVTTDKQEELNCRIQWTSEDYKPSKAGTFHFRGTPILPAGATYINPDKIAAECTVKVTVDYDPSTTYKYYIDEITDFTNNPEWTSRGASDGRSEDLLEMPADAVYTVEDGVLKRLDAAGLVYDHAEIRSLTYIGDTYRNFQLDVDFRQGGNTFGQAFVVFGIQDPTSYVTLSQGGVAAYLTMEGNARFRGALVQNTNSYGEVRSNIDYKFYNDTWRTEMHHLTLRVRKNLATLEVDGVEVMECSLKDGYSGGYIGLMSNKNMARYDNFTITALDYNGNVITKEAHDKLPNEYELEDPMIGEETDDGSAVEIIGLAYKTDIKDKYLGIVSNGSGNSSKPSGTSPDTGVDTPMAIFASALLLAGYYVLLSGKRIVRNKK